MTLSINDNAPLALSHGLTRTSPADDPILSHFDKIQSLKKQAKTILETTTWPGRSAAVAQEFLNTIKDIPNLRNIPDRAVPSSSNLYNDVQRFIKILEDVRGGLESASLEYGAGRKGVSGSIKDAISWGAGRSSKILRSCRKDVEKAWTPLHIDTTQDSIPNLAPMDVSTSNPDDQDDVELSSHIPQNIYHPSFEATHGVKSQDNSIGAEEPPANQTGTTQNATPSPAPPGMSTASPGDQEKKGSVSAEALNAAGKIFTAVDTVSGLIPIVGRYVGAAAKVGSAVVEMVQRMDGNEQMAKDFEKRASKLSDLLGYFKEQSVRTGGESVKTRIDGLKSEITDLQKQVDEWKSTGKLKKAFSATDDSDALNASVKAVENCLAEMQVLASLNITDLLEQLCE
ncbi:hypothetical protein FRC00_006059 [Tulasnella sp. 408]|nr:hypothetical protein FRC00_006059 [Tulasnella sp. 408]